MGSMIREKITIMRKVNSEKYIARIENGEIRDVYVKDYSKIVNERNKLQHELKIGAEYIGVLDYRISSFTGKIYYIVMDITVAIPPAKKIERITRLVEKGLEFGATPDEIAASKNLDLMLVIGIARVIQGM